MNTTSIVFMFFLLSPFSWLKCFHPHSMRKFSISVFLCNERRVVWSKLYYSVLPSASHTDDPDQPNELPYLPNDSSGLAQAKDWILKRPSLETKLKKSIETTRVRHV